MTLIGIDASRAVTRQRTGTEAYASFLIQALLPLAEAAGHRVRLYFNQPPPAGLFPSSAQVTHVVIPFPRLWTHLRLAAELHQHPPDVFFTPAHVIPASYFGPSVATVHDLGYHHFPQAHPLGQRLYLRWSTRHNARRSRLVAADSQATKDDLVRLDGIAPEKVRVVYPGIDPSLTAVSDPATITAVTSRRHINQPYFLYIGTIQPRKNLVRVIEAFAAANLPHHQLVLAGKQGWLSQPILDAAANLPENVRTRIRFIGFVPETDKAALISGAQLLVYPSLYEGFGFPLLEGQACGTAVLAANTSSLPEIAGDGALLVDPLDTAAIAQAMRQLAEDGELRQRLVQAGFANVRRFTWETAASQLLACLLESTRL